jgi:chitin disaccharide deacetylase
MGRPEAVRRLIVNADDFGRSHSINQAVVRAHREGILTSASLMMNEPGSQEAACLARENPNLGVGLHLTLICGHAVSSPTQIPDLVDPKSNFSSDPFRTGVRYFLRRSLRPQMENEIAAQFEAFRATGLKLDHVNGHLHFHLHPTVFRILMRRARDWDLTHVRLTCDPFLLNLKLASGQLFYRLGHALIFNLLSPWARPKLALRRIKHTSTVFGLLQNARVDEDYLRRLIPLLPPGDSELYSHPSLDEFKNELDALISPEVKALIQQHGVTLIRYQDL